ncbi:MAG: S8 family serine peptidase, partial [Bacteroidales bacterium]|nr:S8 family serine peptidase [Bacteroidales bacterium]
MKKFTLFNLVFQGNLNIKKVATISLLLIASFLRSQTYYDVGKYKLLFLDEKYYDISDGDTFQVKTDYILIKLNDTISENRKQAFNSTFPITPQNTSSSQIIRYSINPGTNFIELVNGFDNSSDVQFYDINHLCPLSDIGRPNDNLALIDSKIINHPNLLWPYEHTGLFEAWQLTSGHSMIIVADLDNGIWENHPDLDYGSDTYSNLWINFGEGSIPDNVDNDQNGKVDDIHGWNFPADNNQLLLEQWPMTSHGTICSSIIAAKTNNNIGIWGVAGGYSTKGISVMMLNIRDVDEPQFIDDAFIPEAIDYAVFNGARIINMPIRIPYNESVETAIHFHFQSDTVFFLGSTGNDNSQPINFPARFEEVLAVGASECNVDDTLADEYRWDWLDFGSNYDTGIDVVAPGGLFIGNVIKENEQYVPDYKFKTYDSVSEFNISTSRAVSFASGVVALMLSANPCLTNDSIESILKRTADTISPEVNHYDSITGWSKWVGYGRINAFKALQPVIIPPIEVNTTWDSDMNIYNNINVEFGAELTIQNCTISISSWAKIIVKPGGKLILNNCILTGICNSIMWPGIEVWGYPNAPQFKYPLLPYPQGVIILNGATIENAVTAINLWKPDDYTMTGGIVEAYNSTFK